MSEADRVFPPREVQGDTTATDEKRFIHTAPRRSGFSAGKSRVVEVVHLRRGRSTPATASPRAAARDVRAETWSDGFCARSPAPLAPHDVQPIAPEPVQPTVHVMPMWEPSAQQVTQPAGPVAEAKAVRRGRPRNPKPAAPAVNTRHFADPFAIDDSGANCVRCGYLVEPGREKRGLMTCSDCG
jgi:hypothetical protein